MFYIVYTDTWSVKISSFLDVPSWMWIMDVCEESSWSLFVPQSPASWIVTGTWAILKEKCYLLLHSCDYLLSHVFAAIRQILRGGIHSFQRNQQKTRENVFLFFFPQQGIEPWTFQFWVFCHATSATQLKLCIFTVHLNTMSYNL